MGGLAPPSPGKTGVLSFLNYDSRVIILYLHYKINNYMETVGLEPTTLGS